MNDWLDEKKKDEEWKEEHTNEWSSNEWMREWKVLADKGS